MYSHRRCTDDSPVFGADGTIFGTSIFDSGRDDAKFFLELVDGTGLNACATPAIRKKCACPPRRAARVANSTGPGGLSHLSALTQSSAGDRAGCRSPSQRP